jgi:RimJ/RimL family protein N-acetyltransferase
MPATLPLPRSVTLARVQLETERLTLRPPEDADLEALVPIFGDPDVMRYIAEGTPWTPEQTRAGLRRWRSFWSTDGFGMFLVTRREDGEVLGDTGLLAWDPRVWRPGSLRAIGEDAEIEIGWRFARHAWGNGYATEAALVVRDWARAEQGFGRLISLIHTDNAASIRVAEKIGSRYERDVHLTGRMARIYANDGGQLPAR